MCTAAKDRNKQQRSRKKEPSLKLLAGEEKQSHDKPTPLFVSQEIIASAQEITVHVSWSLSASL